VPSKEEIREAEYKLRADTASRVLAHMVGNWKGPQWPPNMEQIDNLTVIAVGMANKLVVKLRTDMP
jgi:hypothetical protein